MKKPEHTLEWLLAYDGRTHYFASGHFVKFEIRLVEESGIVPHGLAYSFTFHEPDGSRLLGFDDAHPVPHSGGRYVKPRAEADHWHRTKTMMSARIHSCQRRSYWMIFLPRLKGYAKRKAFRLKW